MAADVLLNVTRHQGSPDLVHMDVEVVSPKLDHTLVEQFFRIDLAEDGRVDELQILVVLVVVVVKLGFRPVHLGPSASDDSVCFGVVDGFKRQLTFEIALEPESGGLSLFDRVDAVSDAANQAVERVVPLDLDFVTGRTCGLSFGAFGEEGEGGCSPDRQHGSAGRVFWEALKCLSDRLDSGRHLFIHKQSP